MAAAVVGPISALEQGLDAHDRARVRAVLADDFVGHDHRLAGLGRIDGADAYVESAAVLWDLAPDIRFEVPFRLALERYGVVSVSRSFGTLREGGGAFESFRAYVSMVERGRVTRLEGFEIEDVDAALARFAELRPQSGR